MASKTGLQNEHVAAVEWEKTQIQELDISATELSSECLTDLLLRIPTLRYLSAGQQDGFNDQVFKDFIEKGNIKNLIALDIDRNSNISEEMISLFLRIQGGNIRGLQLSGISHLSEQFWNQSIPLLKQLRYEIKITFLNILCY